MSKPRVPSFKLLAGFEAAARLGSFARAADELSVSQSAISHQIRQLEEQVGQPLFRRVGRGVELTMAGEVLKRSTARSLEVIRSGLGRISAYSEEGLVVLVCPAPIVHGWLQSRLDNLLKDLPGLCPIISTDETANYIDELDVDIVISKTPLAQSDAESEVFLKDELIAVCVPHLVELGGQQAKTNTNIGFLCLENDMTDEIIGNHLREHFAHLSKMTIYDDARLLLDAALRGRGIACVSKLLADEALKTKQLVVLKNYPPLPLVSLWISRMKGETRSPLVLKFYDWLVQKARETDTFTQPRIG